VIPGPVVGDHRVAGQRITLTIGLLVLLFSLFDAWKSGPLGAAAYCFLQSARAEEGSAGAAEE
jgi:hypothetical protein